MLASSASDVMVYPPMLPLIAHDAKFVFSTDLEVQQFAANAALVAQLQDSLACWLSHIADLHQERAALLDTLDREHFIDLAALEPQFVQMELALSYHQHFDRKEVLACTRLLQLVPAAAANLRRLEQELKRVKELHDDISTTLTFVSNVAAFIRHPWTVSDAADTIPPLFSALRALWVCSPVFGPAANLSRFSAVVAFVVRRVETCVHDACCTAVDRIIQSPSLATSIKQDLVASQEAIVALQECFYDLRESQAACGVMSSDGNGRGLHTVLADVDDVALFSLVEWQYERVKALLVCIDHLRSDPSKIGSVLTDPLYHIDLLDPDGMDQPTILTHINRIALQEAPSADAILDRMSQKQHLIASSQSKSNKGTASTAPRIPFDQLSNGLMVLVEFNPTPVITFLGGPVSVGFLDACQYSLPMCCSNANVRSLTRKTPENVVMCLGHNIQQLVIHDQFCDEVHVVHMLATILDLIEAEDAWKMTDTLAQYYGTKEVHWMHFRKHRTKKTRAGVLPSSSRSVSPLEKLTSASAE